MNDTEGFELDTLDVPTDEVPMVKPLTVKSLKEKLQALEEAFRSFREGGEFYAVDISLQGHFDSTIVKAASESEYSHSINLDNGFLQFIKDKITITLT